MDERTKALAAATLAIVLFSLLIQRARRKLTPDQLFALERANRISLYTFLPLVPFLAALPIAYFTEVSQGVTFWGAAIASLALFSWDSWRSYGRLAAAALPPDYLRSHALGLLIMFAGLLVAVAFVAQGIKFRS